MSDLNKGEIGQLLIINFGEDISAATEAIMIVQPQVGTTKEFVATIPNTSLVFNGETLNADEYVLYTTVSEEDVDYAGRWRYKAKLTFSSADVRQSNFNKFRVLN